MRRIHLSESNLLAAVAVAIGAAGGLAAVALQSLIDGTETFSRWTVGHLEPWLGRFAIGLAPVLGALVAGPIIYRLAIEAKGHGVPEVMEAVVLHGGRIRSRVAVIKALASAVTIGTGGSAGREGPIAQIGASLGSTAAGLLRMSEQRTRTLVAAGAAAGIAAAFNAPLAGVFFALEVILQRFTTRGFATVVLSAVTASAVWRIFRGNAPVFRVALYTLEHPVELVFYLGLGLLAALVAIVFVEALYWIEDRFDAIHPIPQDLRPAVGAVVVGLCGAASPFLLGTGIRGIDSALGGELAMGTLLLLLAGKVVATSFTLGSGASGGVFSPSLFMGAMLGAVYGTLLGHLFPGFVAPPTAYAMVGMGAVFAGAAQAPITSILILFEMTNDYRIILPLMLACVASTLLYSAVRRETIYTGKLVRRGVELTQGRERHLLESIPVTRAVSNNYATIEGDATVDAMAAVLDGSTAPCIVVTMEGDRFLGLVLPETVHEALAAGNGDPSELVQRDVPVARADESLDDALRRLAVRGLDVLPVLDSSRRVLGVATRDTLLRAYWNALGETGRGTGHRPG
jgi:CIC family chloride channel protein